ncbi:hypothetical protein A9Q99_00895 [Gammaproteobacteria bacterium 45_16_T64]|nr:hypothetical protein A9Q99_00895 [Gammaproteobacteria bacterium 45_16_T64]
MIRKLTAALIGVGVMVPGLANALGLGGIDLDSALSEPLNAKIELVQVRELRPEEILVNLASAADFKDAGVERFHSLTDVRFEVIVNTDGSSYIKLKSRKPIREPFINFLIEVNWPAGRLLREYTLLLDPPVFSATRDEPILKAPTVSAPVEVTPPPRVVTPAPVTTVSQPVAKAPVAPSPAVEGASSEGSVYGPTKSSDSLWGIARQLRPSSSVSIQQTMVAIQRLNPDAFINGNINLLKKGKVLRGPSEQEVRELTSREAIAQVAQQNREWKDRAAGSTSKIAEAPQIDTSGRAVDNLSDEPVSTGAHLKLVSASEVGESASGQGGAGADGSAALEGKLEIAEEQVDQFRLETEDLKVRNSDLKEQLDTSDQVISLKDDQIMALQLRLKEIEKEMAVVKEQQLAAVSLAGSEPEMVVDEGVSPEAEIQDELVPEQKEVVEATEEPPVDFNYEDTATEEVAATGELGIDGQQPIVVEETVQTPVEVTSQPVVKEKPQQDDFLTTLLNNPIYMAAGGGLILLLIVGAMLAGRKKKDEDDQLADSLVDDFNLEGIGGSDSEAFSSLEEEDVVESTEIEEDVLDEETVPQTADVIGEADIYIAYGRFPQAIDMLEKAAETEPDRPDIRAKLLEVAVEAGDVEAFKRHDAVLQNVGNHDHLAMAAELRSKLNIEDDVAEETLVMPADDLGSSMDLDASVSEAELSEDIGTLDFDMDLSEDDTVEAVEDSFLGQEAEAVEVEDTSLDFDLDFSAEESVTSEDALDSEEDELTLDLPDLDAELGLDLDASDDEESLDFDADLGLDVDIEPISDFAEADESLDVDLGLIDTTDDVEIEAVEESDGLEFDLDIDTELSPAEEPVDESSEPDDLVLDSDTAAMLADELDLDGDFDLDIDVEVDAEAGVDDDATVIITPEVAVDEPAIEVPAVAPPIPEVEAANQAGGDDLDFLTDADEISTKLDLARAYIDMGDRDGAKDILDEVMIEGTGEQQDDAKDLLAKLD